MSSMTMLYVLCAAVAAAGALFIVMIVVMALRRPERPTFTPVTLAPHRAPTLDRVISTLQRITPAFALPVAQPIAPTWAVQRPMARNVFDEEQATTRIVQQPRKSITPIAPTTTPRPSPTGFAQPPPADDQRLQLSVPTRPTVRPMCPTRRPRRLLRFTLGMLAASVLVAAVPVARPQILDPICDDYEWFGAAQASVLREHAWTAHDAIYDLVN